VKTSFPHPSPARRAGAGFTLVELLVTIMVLTVVISATTGMAKSWRSQQVLAAAMRLQQDLQLARSMAVKRGQPVEVRLYSNLDPTLTTPTPQFKTWQLVGYDPLERRLAPLSELRRFESTVVMHRSTRFSTVATLERELDYSRDPMPTFLQTRVCSIEFRPDGSTALDPDPAITWTITLVTDGHAEEMNQLPPDARFLVITPENGAVSQF
jgi:uncharacterized protein (TIGR02596 family)